MIEFFSGNDWKKESEIVHILIIDINYDKDYHDISLTLALLGFGFTIVIGE